MNKEVLTSLSQEINDPSNQINRMRAALEKFPNSKALAEAMMILGRLVDGEGRVITKPNESVFDGCTMFKASEIKPEYFDLPHIVSHVCANALQFAEFGM